MHPCDLVSASRKLALISARRRCRRLGPLGFTELQIGANQGEEKVPQENAKQAENNMADEVGQRFCALGPATRIGGPVGSNIKVVSGLMI